MSGAAIQQAFQPRQHIHRHTTLTTGKEEQEEKQTDDTESHENTHSHSHPSQNNEQHPHQHQHTCSSSSSICAATLLLPHLSVLHHSFLSFQSHVNTQCESLTQQIKQDRFNRQQQENNNKQQYIEFRQRTQQHIQTHTERVEETITQIKDTLQRILQHTPARLTQGHTDEQQHAAEHQQLIEEVEGLGKAMSTLNIHRQAHHQNTPSLPSESTPSDTVTRQELHLMQKQWEKLFSQQSEHIQKQRGLIKQLQHSISQEEQQQQIQFSSIQQLIDHRLSEQEEQHQQQILFLKQELAALQSQQQIITNPTIAAAELITHKGTVQRVAEDEEPMTSDRGSVNNDDDNNEDDEDDVALVVSALPHKPPIDTDIEAEDSDRVKAPKIAAQIEAQPVMTTEAIAQEQAIIGSSAGSPNGLASAVPVQSSGKSVLTTTIPYNLFLRVRDLPLNPHGANNPIAALFIPLPYESEAEYQYSSQTEWLKDTKEPVFQQALLWDYCPSLHSPSSFVKINVYDVMDENVRDEDRVGSVLVQVQNLINQADDKTELTYSLAHEDAVKHQRAQQVTIIVECEVEQTTEQIEQAGNADKQGEDAPIPSCSLSLSCVNLPCLRPSGVCNPIAALFVQSEPNQSFMYSQQTEWMHDDQHPVFQQSLLFDAQQCTQNSSIQLCVYDVETEQVRDEDKVGSLVFSASELSAYLQHGNSREFPLSHEATDRQQTLKDMGTTLIVNFQSPQQRESSSPDSAEDVYVETEKHQIAEPASIQSPRETAEPAHPLPLHSVLSAVPSLSSETEIAMDFDDAFAIDDEPLDFDL